MAEGLDAGTRPDRLSLLIEQLVGGSDEADAALPAEVHRVIHPLCLNLLGSVDAAYEAEQETWRRLMEHLQRHGPGGTRIVNGTGYVQQIARNVCRDLGRRITQRRREADLAEVAEARVSTGDPTWTDITAAPARSPLNAGVPAKLGYRSSRLLADLAGLSQQEVRVLCLRQEGHAYADIARLLGDGLTTATAQTQGERAMHHLRGRVQVAVWRQQPLPAWDTPGCPELAAWKQEVRECLARGGAVTTTLYRAIGKHLDPHPNRSRGRGDDPACPLCRPERKRTELTYWWMIVTLPPLVALGRPAAPPPAHLVAAHSAMPPPQPAVPAGEARYQTAARGGRSRRRVRGRTIAGICAAIVLVVATLAAALLAHRDNPRAALPPASLGSPTPAAGATTPAVFTLPAGCQLVTPADVTAAVGGPAFDACDDSANTPAGGLAVAGGVHGWYRRMVGTQMDQVSVGGWDLRTAGTPTLDQACAAARQALPGTTGTVPNLGDENCYVRYDDGLVADAVVHVRRGNLLLWTNVTIRGATVEMASRLVGTATDRLR